MQHTDAFSRAARELEDLVKSKRGAQTLQQMSDAKDYDEENLDDFDRAPQGVRNKRLANERWAGIQAQFAEAEEEHDAYKENMRELLVSGRRARIRFPGAKGDSELRPFDRQRYVEDADVDEDFPAGNDRIRERNASIRGSLGGDALSWRAQAKRDGIGEDRYTSGKSLRTISGLSLLKSFGAIKSKLQRAMFDEQLDPRVLMNFEAAGTEPRLGVDLSAAMRALAQVSPAVRAQYGIPSISNNRFEEMGEIRRGY